MRGPKFVGRGEEAVGPKVAHLLEFHGELDPELSRFVSA